MSECTGDSLQLNWRRGTVHHAFYSAPFLAISKFVKYCKLRNWKSSVVLSVPPHTYQMTHEWNGSGCLPHSHTCKAFSQSATSLFECGFYSQFQVKPKLWVRSRWRSYSCEGGHFGGTSRAQVGGGEKGVPHGVWRPCSSSPVLDLVCSGACDREMEAGNISEGRAYSDRDTRRGEVLENWDPRRKSPWGPQKGLGLVWTWGEAGTCLWACVVSSESIETNWGSLFFPPHGGVKPDWWNLNIKPRISLNSRWCCLSLTGMAHSYCLLLCSICCLRDRVLPCSPDYPENSHCNGLALKLESSDLYRWYDLYLRNHDWTLKFRCWELNLGLVFDWSCAAALTYIPSPVELFLLHEYCCEQVSGMVLIIAIVILIWNRGTD